MCGLLPAVEPRQRRTRKMRFQQEEVDSAWCSPASGRAGWGASLAFGCPPGRLGAGQEAISLAKQGNLAQCSETNRSGTHEGSDLACLSKPGERHDSWRRWRTSVLPKVRVARSGFSLSFLGSARELSNSGRLARERGRRSASVADGENRRRRLSRRSWQKFRGWKRRSRMRGSVTRLNKKIGCGFIPSEDGFEAYFDLSSLEGIDIQT